jgi:hypothetical protein
MNALFNQRFEQGFEAASRGISKKGGTKRLSKVWERIGRLKEKYPSVHKYYDISIQDNGKGLATGMTYQKKPGTSQASRHHARLERDRSRDEYPKKGDDNNDQCKGYNHKNHSVQRTRRESQTN